MSTQCNEAQNFVKGVTHRSRDRHFTSPRAVMLSHSSLVRQVPVTLLSEKRDSSPT